MSRELTHKERGFVEDFASGMTGTAAALKNYDTKNEDTAAVIASQNLGKLKIQQALKELGFDADNAKRVVGEILNNEELEPKDRLKASELVFKVTGDFAPEKHLIFEKKIIKLDV